jgi:hypothetical protein
MKIMVLIDLPKRGEVCFPLCTKYVHFEQFCSIHYDKWTIMHCTQVAEFQNKLTTAAKWNLHVTHMQVGKYFAWYTFSKIASLFEYIYRPSKTVHIVHKKRYRPP